MKHKLTFVCFCLLIAFSSLSAQWVDITPSGMGPTIGDLDFWDANHGMVASNNGVYLTSDGGSSWQLNNSCVGLMVDYISTSELLTASENGICTSVDGGTIWNPMPLPFFTPSSIQLTEVDFLTDSMGAIVYQTNFNTWTWAKTTDRGLTWSQHGLPGNVTSQCIGTGAFRERMAMLSPENAIVLVGDSLVYQTLDAGQSWNLIFSGDFVPRIERKSDSTYFVGPNFFTNDQGQTWSTLIGAGPQACDFGVLSPSAYTRAICNFITPNSWTGDVELTTDAGSSWTSLSGGFGYGCPDQLHFVDGTTLYAQNIFYGTSSDYHRVKKWMGALLANEEQAIAAWEVYPNPVAEVLYIRPRSVGNEVELRLWDVQGRVVLQKVQGAVAGKVFTLSVEAIPAGIYGLEIRSEKQRFFRKVKID